MKLLGEKILDVNESTLNMVKYLVSTFDEYEMCELFRLIYDCEENENLDVLNIANINIKDPYNFIDGGIANTIYQGDHERFVIDKLEDIIIELEEEME